MSNVINYTGLDAKIKFSSKQMMFIGCINDNNKKYEFKALTLSELKTEYEKISDEIYQAQEIRAELSTQLISIEQIVQSGDAQIFVDESHSDLRLGMMIKMLLAISDGASFTVSQKITDQNITGVSL